MAQEGAGTRKRPARQAAQAPADGRVLAAQALARQADDIGEARKALESATGISRSLWITFISFGAYLAIAVGSVKHVDLFLENPVKLPLLNVDLPLVTFFWIAPILLLIVHAYLLINLKLLADNIRVWEKLVEQSLEAAPVADRRKIADGLRMQLPNFIVVQMLAAPWENRRGFMGWITVAAVAITVVFGPLVLFCIMQAQFLPYHSEAATRLHRLSLIADMALIAYFWPRIDKLERVQNGETVYQKRVRRGIVFKLAVVLGAVSLFVLSVFIATFPGEKLHGNGIARLVDGIGPAVRVACASGPKTKLESGLETATENCERLTLSEALFDGPVNEVTGVPRSLFSNRLVLTNRDFVDDEKLAMVETTRSFRGRRLERAVLVRTDLRKADFTSARMTGADLSGAKLQGARFDCGVVKTVREKNEESEELTECVQLVDAKLVGTQLQGSFLDGTNLTGANLESAQLQAASLRASFLVSTKLLFAQLTGADLYRANLRGAIVESAKLQGADLNATNLQWAIFVDSDLRGAQIANDIRSFALGRRNLNGAIFARIDFRGARVRFSQMWNDTVGVGATFIGLPFDSKDEVSRFINESLLSTPEGLLKEQARQRLQKSMDLTDTSEYSYIFPSFLNDMTPLPNSNGDTKWLSRKWKTRIQAIYRLLCNSNSSGLLVETLVHGSDEFGEFGHIISSGPYFATLARAILNPDGCPASSGFEEPVRETLAYYANETVACELPLPWTGEPPPPRTADDAYCFRSSASFSH